MNSLILSGGGAKGAFEAGVLYQIFKAKEFDYLFGTSVGALNCILLAQSYLDNSPYIFKKVWIEMIKNNNSIYKKNYFRTLCGNPPFDFSPLRKILKENIDFEEILKMDKEIKITTVDLVTGKSIVISNKKTKETDEFLESAIASCSIPPAFLPVKINGKHLVDGGVRDNVPTKQILMNDDNGGSVLMVLCNPKDMEERTGEYNGLIKIGMRTIDIMIHEITRNDINTMILINELIKRTPEENKSVWLAEKKVIDIDIIEPDTDLGNTLNFDPRHMCELFNYGRIKASKYLMDH